MIERKLSPQELLDGYRKTTVGITKAKRVALLAEKESLALDRQREDYPEIVLRKGRLRQCLLERALPLLASRKKLFENEIINHLPEDDRLKALEISRLVEHKNLPQTVFESTLIALGSRHLGNTKINSEKPENGVGKAPAKTGATINAEPAKKERNGDQSIEIRGKKIIFRANANLVMKVLRALEKTSENEPLSGSLLKRAVYGSEISSNFSRDRAMASMLTYLRKRLGEQGFTIVNLHPGGRGVEALYYLEGGKDNSKNDGVEPSAEEKPPETAADRTEDILFVLKNLRSPEAETEQVAAVAGDESPQDGEKPDINSPLSSNEVYAIAKRLLCASEADNDLLATYGINVESLYGESVSRLISRMDGDLSHKKISVREFEREHFGSAIEKIKYYVKNPAKHFGLSQEVKILLSCFASSKLEDGLWDKLQASDFNPAVGGKK